MYLFCLLFILNSFPTNLSAQTARDYLEQAVEAIQKGDTSKCLAMFDRAIKVDKKYTATYGFRAMFKLNCKKYHEAVADMDTAIAMGGNLNDYTTRAFLKESANTHKAGHYSFQEILNDYNFAVRMWPTFADPFISRAEFYRDMKMFVKAITDLNKAISILTSTHQNAGYLYARRARYKNDSKAYSVHCKLNKLERISLI